MICMKARDYLTLIKWLDWQRGNNLSRFCLLPKFWLPQESVFEINGKWDENSEPCVLSGFEYLLDFYVKDDQPGLEDRVLTSARVTVCPGRVECDAAIPGGMLRDRIADVMRIHDEEWAEAWKRNSLFARLFGRAVR